MRRISPPDGLGRRGRALWTSCLNSDDELTDSDNPMRAVALEAARLVDQLDTLQSIVDRDGEMISTTYGDKIHPAFAELQKGRSLLARLVASLRIPDEQTGKRPKRRTVRTQQASKPGGRSGKVTPLDRARRAAGGA